jgi:hypothetical protein
MLEVIGRVLDLGVSSMGCARMKDPINPRLTSALYESEWMNVVHYNISNN